MTAANSECGTRHRLSRRGDTESSYACRIQWLQGGYGTDVDRGYSFGSEDCRFADCAFDARLSLKSDWSRHEAPRA
jgi:hypothetical protein